MHVSDVAHTCGSVARGLVQAYVKGCESICVVPETASPARVMAEPGAREDGKAPIREQSDAMPYHTIPRLL